jgi:hypothetical protein
MYNLLSFVIQVTSWVVCFLGLLGMDSASPMELTNQLRDEFRGAIG